MEIIQLVLVSTMALKLLFCSVLVFFDEFIPFDLVLHFKAITVLRSLSHHFFVRKDILRRDRYTCSICRTRLRKRFLDVDHIIPVQMGGKLFEKANLRTLCKECHKAKSKLDSEALSGLVR